MKIKVPEFCAETLQATDMRELESPPAVRQVSNNSISIEEMMPCLETGNDPTPYLQSISTEAAREFVTVQVHDPLISGRNGALAQTPNQLSFWLFYIV